VGIPAISAWSRGRIFPAANNLWLTANQLITGNTPYLKIDRVLPTSGYVTGVTWSKDGSRIAAISAFGRFGTVWNTDGVTIAEFTRDGPYVGNAIAFVTNDLLASPATNKTQEDERLALTLWDVQTGSIARSVEGPAPGQRSAFNLAHDFALSPDGLILAALAG